MQVETRARAKVADDCPPAIGSMPAPYQLILYSKPGCHLCDGVRELLQQVQIVAFELEIRDITRREDWFAAYQYDIPVLTWARDGAEIPLPRFSPRTSLARVEQLLQNALQL